MLLTLGTCISRPDTAAGEYSLRYPGRRRPDTSMYRRLKKRIRQTGSLTPTAHVNAFLPRAAASEDAIFVAVEQEP